MTSRISVLHQTPAQIGTANGVDLSGGATDAVLAPGEGSTHGKVWQATMSDVGVGWAILHNTDTNLPAIDHGHFLRFSLDGVPRFLVLIDELNTTAIAPNEEIDQVTVVKGKGSLNLWKRGALLPANGVGGQPWSETVVFDWGHPDLDISTWAAAVELTQAGQGSEGTPPPEFPVRWLGYPLGWSDPTGYWVWSEAAGAGPAMPAGTSYFARDVNVPTSGYHAVYMAADNRHHLKIDGVTVSTFDDERSQEGYRFTQRADVYLTAGTHRIAVRVTNDDGMELAGFLFALWSQDAERNDDTLILRADATWKALGYPTDPPAFTVGKVLRLVKEQTPALADWSLSFTDTLDSDGAAWPTDQQYSFRVGTDPLTILRQLGNTDVDYVADPSSLTLHAYKIGTMGVGTPTATLDRLSYLEFQGRA